MVLRRGALLRSFIGGAEMTRFSPTIILGFLRPPSPTPWRSRRWWTYMRECWPIVGVQETVLLVNHAPARGTPAIFVIFVVSRGSSSKALVLLVRMQIRHFRHLRQKPPFSGGTKARFTKSTVFGTPMIVHSKAFKLELHPHLGNLVIVNALQ